MKQGLDCCNCRYTLLWANTRRARRRQEQDAQKSRAYANEQVSRLALHLQQTARREVDIDALLEDLETLPPLTKIGQNIVVCGGMAHALLGECGPTDFDDNAFQDAFTVLRAILSGPSHCIDALIALGVAAHRLYGTGSRSAFPASVAPARNSVVAAPIDTTPENRTEKTVFTVDVAEAEADLLEAARTGEWPTLIYDDPQFIDNATTDTEYTPEIIATEKAAYIAHRGKLLANLSQAVGTLGTEGKAQ